MLENLQGGSLKETIQRAAARKAAKAEKKAGKTTPTRHRATTSTASTALRSRMTKASSPSHRAEKTSFDS